MKGLLMKDIILLRPQLKIYLIILVFWFLIAMWNGQPGFFGGLMAMFALMIPMTTVAYDDNCKWPAFALTAPVSRFKLVLSKYVILFMTMLVLSVIIFIGSLVMGEDVSGSLLSDSSHVPLWHDNGFGAVAYNFQVWCGKRPLRFSGFHRLRCGSCRSRRKKSWRH